MNGQAPTSGDDALRQALSALMDGDADHAMAERACAAWRSHPEARADWHAYHVIGDVLRTPDLSPSVCGDAAFLEAFRVRLKQEPVVVAPVAAVPGALPMDHQQANGTAVVRRGYWRAPMAAAAGVAAVAGVVFITRFGLPDAGQGGAVVASSAQPRAAAVESAASRALPAPAAGQQAAVPAVVIVRDQRMLRDERLDRYLEAHRQFGQSSLSFVPATTARGASVQAPER